MKTILLLAACAFCILSAQADEDYPTIVRYLGENGHLIISPDEVAKVQAFMKANGYQHVSEIPKGTFAVGDSAVAQPVVTPNPTPTPTLTVDEEMGAILNQLKNIDLEAEAERQKAVSCSNQLGSLNERMATLTTEQPNGWSEQFNALSNQFSQILKDFDTAKQKQIALVESKGPLINRFALLAEQSGIPSKMQEAFSINADYIKLLEITRANL
jgi:hypothetical protein